eukprot:s1564_g21.t1
MVDGRHDPPSHSELALLAEALQKDEREEQEAHSRLLLRIDELCTHLSKAAESPAPWVQLEALGRQFEEMQKAERQMEAWQDGTALGRVAHMAPGFPLVRLGAALRDLYHEICERGSPWTEEDGNPWEDKSPDAKRTCPVDKGTSTSPPSVDGGTTSPMSFTDASPQEGDDLLSTWDQPRRQDMARLAAEPMAPPRRVEQEMGVS